MIGVALVAEGFHFYIPKGSIYFAMAFSAVVETLHICLRAKSKAVAMELRQAYR